MMNGLRMSAVCPILIEAEGGLTLLIPAKKSDRAALLGKFNPFTLVVAVNEQGGITLNGERQSSQVELTEWLKEIFLLREINGVFREGTSEIEKTVYLKMPLSSPFSEIIKIATAIKEGEAFPIVLLLDDLDQ